MNNDPLPNLEALHAVDRIVAVTSTLQPGLYDDATYSTLNCLDVLSTEKNAAGGWIVSQESLLGAEPDLVIALENAVDRAALAASGIPVYTPSAYCANPGRELSEPATFDRVMDEVRTLGALLGETDRADDVIAAAKESVRTPAAENGTAAALYVSSEAACSRPTADRAWSPPSSQRPDFRNVYADTNERVFSTPMWRTSSPATRAPSCCSTPAETRRTPSTAS